MKTNAASILILSLIILLAFSSCTMEKRLYRPGFHVDFVKSHHNTTAKRNVESKNRPATKINTTPLITERQVSPKQYLNNKTSSSEISQKVSKQLPVSFKETKKQNTEYASDEPTADEKKEVKREIVGRIVLNSLVAGLAVLFTVIELFIPACIIALCAILLIYCRKDPLYSVRKRAEKRARNPIHKTYPSIPDSEKEIVKESVVEYTKEPVNTPMEKTNSIKGVKRFHFGGLLALPFLFFPPFSLFGLLISGTALSDMKKSPNKYTGKGYTQFVFVLSLIETILVVAFFVAVLIAISL